MWFRSKKKDLPLGVIHDGEVYHRERLPIEHASFEMMEKRAKEQGLIAFEMHKDYESGTVLITSFKRKKG